jgi:hypothetical protein
MRMRATIEVIKSRRTRRKTISSSIFLLLTISSVATGSVSSLCCGTRPRLLLSVPRRHWDADGFSDLSRARRSRSRRANRLSGARQVPSVWTVCAVVRDPQHSFCSQRQGGIGMQMGFLIFQEQGARDRDEQIACPARGKCRAPGQFVPRLGRFESEDFCRFFLSLCRFFALDFSFVYIQNFPETIFEISRRVEPNFMNDKYIYIQSTLCVVRQFTDLDTFSPCNTFWLFVSPLHHFLCSS